MEECCILHRVKTGITPFPEGLKNRFRDVTKYVTNTKILVEEQISHMHGRQLHCNVTPSSLQSLLSLKDHKTCLLKKIDKNTGLAVIHRTLHLTLCQQALNLMYLRRLSCQEMISSFVAYQDELRALKVMLSKSLLERMMSYLYSSVEDWFQYITILCGLPKVHKPVLKVRPIVAASQLPFK